MSLLSGSFLFRGFGPRAGFRGLILEGCSSKGSSKGSVNGYLKGSFEGFFKGSVKGSFKGSFEGSSKGFIVDFWSKVSEWTGCRSRLVGFGGQ